MLLVFFWQGWQLPLAPTFIFMLKDTTLKKKRKKGWCAVSADSCPLVSRTHEEVAGTLGPSRGGRG